MRILHRNGIPFFFLPHLTVSWAIPVAKAIFSKRCYACNIEVPEESQFSDSVLWLYEPAI